MMDLLFEERSWSRRELEGRGLVYNYVKTSSRERSPDLETRKKRWKRRAGSMVRSGAIFTAEIFPSVRTLSLRLNL